MKLVHGFYGMYTQTGVTVKETRPGGKTVIVPPKESEVAEYKTVIGCIPATQRNTILF